MSIYETSNCSSAHLKSEVKQSVCRSDSPPATIPADISTTTSRPNLVLITEPEVTILELTIPFNLPGALAAARSRKSLGSNYLQHATDLEDSGWSVAILLRVRDWISRPL